MATKGFSLQQKTGLPEQYVTVNPAGKDKFGLDVLHKNFYPLTPVAQDILDYVPSSSAPTGVLEVTAHGARLGDSIRFIDGANNRVEVPILNIVDADHITIYKPSVDTIVPNTDKLFILRPISPTADEDGNLIVAVTVPPIQYTEDGVPVTVNIDTLVPADSTPLPTAVFGNDGVKADVSQNSSNANYSLNVKDSDVLVELADQTAELVDINSELDTVSGLLTDIETNTAGTVTELQSVNTELDTQSGLLTDIKTNTLDIPNVIAAEGGTQPSKGMVVMGHTGAGIVKHILVDTNGIQSVNVNNSALPTGGATAANQVTGNTHTADIPNVIGTDGGSVPSKAIMIGGTDGTNFQAISVDATGAVNTNIGTVALPTGASTEAKQDTGNTSLANIETDIALLEAKDFATETTLSALNTKIPSQGQALMAASVPVTLASDQPALPVAFGTPAPAGVYNAKVTVGTTAIQITCNGSSPSAIRQKLVFSPVGPTAAKFYFGNSAVTSSGSNQGIELVYGQSVEFNNDPNEYYIISDTASQSVAILEVY
jgi:hypothetical protein